MKEDFKNKFIHGVMGFALGSISIYVLHNPKPSYIDYAMLMVVLVAYLLTMFKKL